MGVTGTTKRSLRGAGHVARWILGVLAKPESAGIVGRPATINGELGVFCTFGEQPAGALTFDLVDGRIHNLRLQLNPDKLTGPS